MFGRSVSSLRSPVSCWGRAFSTSLSSYRSAPSTSTFSNPTLPTQQYRYYVKETTGLAGVPVVPDARHILTNLYNKILKEVREIPETAAYRIDTEITTKHRLNVLTQPNLTDEEVEKEIDAGQLEELIMQAEGELLLIPKMAEWKPWEAPANEEIQVVYEQPGENNWIKDLILKDRAEEEARKKAEAEEAKRKAEAEKK